LLIRESCGRIIRILSLQAGYLVQLFLGLRPQVISFLQAVILQKIIKDLTASFLRRLITAGKLPQIQKAKRIGVKLNNSSRSFKDRVRLEERL